jgi:hypothetical protein
VLGRFLSADTIVPSPADPQSLNRFSYTRNNPLKYIDPNGHKECEKASELGTCESATNHERDQAVAYNNLCAYDPAACQWGTQAGEIGTTFLVFGIGLAGGALIGIGARLVGAAAFATGGSAAATTSGLFGLGLVGADTGVLTGGGVTVFNALQSGQKVDPVDLLINSASTGGAGFISGLIPGLGAGSIAARAVVNGLFSGGPSAWSDMAHGRSVDWGKGVTLGWSHCWRECTYRGYR